MSYRDVVWTQLYFLFVISGRNTCCYASGSLNTRLVRTALEKIPMR
jgi:hypothetical protein